MACSQKLSNTASAAAVSALVAFVADVLPPMVGSSTRVLDGNGWRT